MGDTKKQMSSITDKAKEMFGKVASKRKPTISDGPQTFADRLAEIDESLDRIIVNKEAELKNEKGQEEKNSLALAKLRTMRFHLDEVIHAASEYSGS